MKKKTTSLLIMTLLVAMSFSVFFSPVAGVVNTSSHNNITVDGDIGTDWADGTYTVRLDPDTVWGGAGVNSLYFALNDTGIFIGLTATRWWADSNPYFVFLDVDPTEGNVDHSLSSVYPRALKSIGDFAPDFFLLGLGTAGFDLYEYTDDEGGTSASLTGTLGVLGAVDNKSISEDLNDLHHETFIPWTVLYDAGIPADAVIKLAAGMSGGSDSDGFYDTIPTDYTWDSSPSTEYNAYVEVKVSDVDGDPQVIPYFVGWPGQNGDGGYTSAAVNDLEGNVTLGLDMEFYYEIWMDGGKSEYINNSYWPTLRVTHYNSTSEANVTTDYTMYHSSGDMAGSNEIFRYSIPVLPENGYAVGDKFYWYIFSDDFSEATAEMYYLVENGISAMPPIDLGYIGAVVPAGGFKDPDTAFDVEVQIEQLWNGTDKVTFNVLTNVFINYTLNATDVWLQSSMEYDSASSDNAIFKGSLGPFLNGTTVEFYIVAENNNTVQTGPYNIIIGIEPPKEEVFYMTDPNGDEWGTYPT
ncbi:MAG: hypothetical protein ACTSYU_05590, partial [Promethearchaeota archaeon]